MFFYRRQTEINTLEIASGFIRVHPLISAVKNSQSNYTTHQIT